MAFLEAFFFHIETDRGRNYFGLGIYLFKEFRLPRCYRILLDENYFYLFYPYVFLGFSTDGSVVVLVGDSEVDVEATGREASE